MLLYLTKKEEMTVIKDHFYTKKSKSHPGWNHCSLDLQSNSKSLSNIRQFLYLPAPNKMIEIEIHPIN